jgi:hypothetical protein
VLVRKRRAHSCPRLRPLVDIGRVSHCFLGDDDDPYCGRIMRRGSSRHYTTLGEWVVDNPCGGPSVCCPRGLSVCSLYVVRFAPCIVKRVKVRARAVDVVSCCPPLERTANSAQTVPARTDRRMSSVFNRFDCSLCLRYQCRVKS